MQLQRLWCLVVWPCAQCFGKVIVNSARVGGPRAENTWRYLSKFGYQVGSGSFAVRIKLVQPAAISARVELPLDIFLDEDWAEVEKLDICNRSSKKKIGYQLEVDAEGGWGKWSNGSLRQSVRPHVWYFVIHDCDHVLQNFTHRIRYEMHMLQHDASHFSCEMSGMLTVHVLAVLILTGLLVKYVQTCRAFMRSADSLHPIIWVLSAAMLLQYVAELMRALNLWSYSYNGAGMKAFDVLAEIMFMLTQVLLTSLLILIALGYTLTQSNLGDLDLMVPVVFMIAIIHVMLVGFGKIRDDASFKFHENEGPVGWVLMALRVLLFIWFVWAVRSTSAEVGMRMRSFLARYCAVGSVYFLWYPVIFLTIGVFAPYVQHKVMTIGMLFMQTGTSIWVANLFLSRGEYFKVSTLNTSFLPGGARVGLDKEE